LHSPESRDALEHFIREGGDSLAFAGSGGPDPGPLQFLETFIPTWSWERRDGSVDFRLEPAAPGHPLLAALQDVHPPVELGTPRFRAYIRALNSGGPAEGLRTLLRFIANPSQEREIPEGDPALVEQTLGQGRILAFLGDCAPASSDFPLKVSFVPFLHGAVAYLAAPARTSVLRKVGDPVPWKNCPDSMQDRDTLLFASTTDTDPAPVPPAGGNHSQARVDRLMQPGFYRLSTKGGEGGPYISAGWFAVNVDPDEGDPARFSLAAANDAIPHGLAALLEHPGDAAGLTARNDQAGSDLYTPLLLIALLLLVAEPILANRRAQMLKKNPAPLRPMNPSLKEVAP
jgi:hypothetical protein